MKHYSYVCEASGGTKSGPDRHQVADLAVVITSRLLRVLSALENCPLGGQLHSFCMMFAHQYELRFSKNILLDSHLSLSNMLHCPPNKTLFQEFWGGVTKEVEYGRNTE